MPLGRLICWPGSSECGPVEGQEAAKRAQSPYGQCPYVHPYVHQPFIFPGLGGRSSLTAVWMGGQLGDAASRLGEPRGAELVPGSGVGAQRPRGPSGHRSQQGPAGAGPGSEQRAAPGCVLVPSMPQTSPCLTPHSILTSASSSTCRQRAWHPRCTARPRPGSCGFSSRHLWGILAWVKRGGTGAVGLGSGGTSPWGSRWGQDSAHATGGVSAILPPLGMGGV